MRVIEVIEPGLLTTVQDLGRPGYGPLGISASGAADPVALRAGNRLLGNPDGAPALEMTLAGGTFGFPEGAVVALAGSDFGASIPMWSACDIPPGGPVRTGVTRSGARCYVCVRGGIDVPRFLGSASVHVLSAVGGRPLRKGDVLTIGAEPEAPRHWRVRRSALERLAPRGTLRVTPGPQVENFPPSALATLLASGYEVTESASRMGLRLRGTELPTPQGGTMITEGVSLGAIQVPASGQPLILFVDAQTTGGYPVLANVIAADLASTGQLRPRDRVRFELVSFEVARRLYFDQQALLQSDELLW